MEEYVGHRGNGLLHNSVGFKGFKRGVEFIGGLLERSEYKMV